MESYTVKVTAARVKHFVTRNDLREVLQYTNRAGVAVKAARYLAENADELVAETASSSELTESSSGDGILRTVQASEKPRDTKYSSKTVEINPHLLYRCLKAVELSLIAENEEPLAHLKEELLSKLNSQEQQSLIQGIAYLKKKQQRCSVATMIDCSLLFNNAI